MKPADWILKRDLFLRTFEREKSVKATAYALGVSKQTVTKWLKKRVQSPPAYLFTPPNKYRASEAIPAGVFVVCDPKTKTVRAA